MVTLEEHVKKLKQGNDTIAGNCPWLSDRETMGVFTKYGDGGALCKPAEKVAAGRAAASAYQVVRCLEYDHLSECRSRLRDELSRRKGLAEEASRFLIKDLFEKCEDITSCISCSCELAIPAYYNLLKLVDLLSNSSMQPSSDTRK